MVAELTASQQRAQDPHFVASLSFPSLLHRLPLSLPVPVDAPSSPKPHYRSQYAYLGYEDLLDLAVWPLFSLFDLALRLIDFSSLEAPLAQILYHPSPKGHVPFHPVSMFLLYSWRIDNQWGRTETLRKLANPLYNEYRKRFGFAKEVYPTEGGLRHFEARLGSQPGNDFIAQTMELAQAAQFISLQAIEHGIMSVDGMIHDAASRLRCSAVDSPCYEPAPRPCRAKSKGKKGCDCDGVVCAQVCKHASPRDPQARFVVYKGHNQGHNPDGPPQISREKDEQSRGKPRYGYRSICQRLIDPVRRTSWVLADDLLAANAAEDQGATTLMEQVVKRFNWVQWKFAVADAGEGREPFLSTAYRLRLRRVVGLRAAEADKDAAQWAIRGYDDKGIPVCPFGYRLHPNGWDSHRRRYKWCCRRRCEKEARPVRQSGGGSEAPDCPHREDGDKHGLVRDVGRSFADGSTRLVRDVPYGSALYKELYGRGRNAAEERNAEFEGLGLKRMPVYGWERVRAMVTVVDMWVNLKTIVRLIQEAVLTANGRSPPGLRP